MMQLRAEGLSGHARAIVDYWVGEAHLRRAEPELALQHIDLALAALDQHGDPWMGAQALHIKSSALYLMDDPECLYVAEAALRRCRELDPPMPMLEARVLNHLAAIAVNREEWLQAIRLYDRALAAAEPLRDLRQLSLMYEGLGMAYHRLGRPGQARELFSKALGLYEVQSDMSSMARAEVNLSELLMDDGSLASAENHLEQSLRYCDEHGVDRRNRTYALVGMAKLRLRQGRLDEVEEITSTTIAIASERGEKLSLASALQVRGQLLVARGDVGETDACYEQAIEIYSSLNLLDRLRSCRIEYAEVLDADGRSGDAKSQWRLAALTDREASRAPIARLRSRG